MLTFKRSLAAIVATGLLSFSAAAQSASGFSGSSGYWKFYGVEASPNSRPNFEARGWRVRGFTMTPTFIYAPEPNGPYYQGRLGYEIERADRPSCRVKATAQWQLSEFLHKGMSFRQNGGFAMRLSTSLEATNECIENNTISISYNTDQSNINCLNTRM